MVAAFLLFIWALIDVTEIGDFLDFIFDILKKIMIGVFVFIAELLGMSRKTKNNTPPSYSVKTPSSPTQAPPAPTKAAPTPTKATPTPTKAVPTPAKAVPTPAKVTPPPVKKTPPVAPPASLPSFVEIPLVGLFVIKNKKFPKQQLFKSGKIIEQNENILTIQFDETKSKWQYPDLFVEEGVLFADPELQAAFEKGKVIFKGNCIKVPSESAPSWGVSHVAPPPITLPPVASPPTVNLTLAEALDRIANAEAPWWVNGSLPGDMASDQKLLYGRHYDTAGRRIYEQGCDTFGWNRRLSGQFGMMKVMYAFHGAPNGESIWMLPHHDGVMKKALKDDAMWWNTFTEDYVFEEWKDPKDGFFTDWSDRITFAKTKQNGYAFIGVFRPVQTLEGIDAKGKMRYIKVYRRIAKEYKG